MVGTMAMLGMRASVRTVLMKRQPSQMRGKMGMGGAPVPAEVTETVETNVLLTGGLSGAVKAAVNGTETGHGSRIRRIAMGFRLPGYPSGFRVLDEWKSAKTRLRRGTVRT